VNLLYLGVNIDHVATVRQARGERYPDPVLAAVESEIAGADNITLHLREDRRHIQERDVVMLKEMIQIPINLEMANTPEMVRFAKKIQPEHVCLVPERREEITTEGGLDVCEQKEAIQKTCAELQQKGIAVSLFIDADKKQIDAALQCEAKLIELHTGQYALSRGEAALKEYTLLREAAQYAHEKGLIVNAGHGLNYHNVQRIASIDVLHGLNIGHAIIARALFTGLTEAVREMKCLMREARG